ncbi:MAG: aldo/keto reductase [Peptococcaceae bacterium]|jgi:predicted aldo/keto reductase-like oxidoreductase|nr:aldo/keto reductase [Peptococcaceae bacterium]MDH7525149.1 aldo/keto reductase [Peptococcaceae bacterium]
MEYKYLGNTGIRVSRFCFGSLTVGPLQANLSLEDGAAVIRYALEKGVNFIDTAKIYGTYPYIKKALWGWDKPVVIASKSYDYTKEGMKKSLEEARLALDRDYIDIFLLHEQESELTLKGHRPALEYLWEAKARGLVKAVGVSTHTVEVVRVASAREDLEVIHPIVNMQGLGLLDGNQADLMAELKRAYENGKGIYGMKPLGGGNLVHRAKEALEFAFSYPYLHSVAVGCKLREEVEYNLKIMKGLEPPAMLASFLRGASRKLHIEDWCTGCGLCVESCPFNLLKVEKGKAVLVGEDCMFCGYCGAACKQFAIKIV